MSAREFFEKVYGLSRREEPFVIATVIRTEGSASARAGAKAIMVEDGRTLYGWVGGGCAESAVREEALAALKDGRPRTIELDLRDEVFGVGMPCGGSMEVYVEPFLPRPPLVVIGHGKIAEAVARLGADLGFSVIVAGPLATEEAFPMADRLIRDDPDLTSVPVTGASFVVITTQHRSDDVALRRALGGGPRYVALVASRTRAKIVFETLIEQGVAPDRLETVRAPAGLDIGAVTPEEIALSIMSEIIQVRRGGAGGPLSRLNRVEVAPPQPLDRRGPSSPDPE